jgi:hypothetical protein
MIKAFERERDRPFSLAGSWERGNREAKAPSFPASPVLQTHCHLYPSPSGAHDICTTWLSNWRTCRNHDIYIFDLLHVECSTGLPLGRTRLPWYIQGPHSGGPRYGGCRTGIRHEQPSYIRAPHIFSRHRAIYSMASNLVRACSSWQRCRTSPSTGARQGDCYGSEANSIKSSEDTFFYPMLLGT